MSKQKMYTKKMKKRIRTAIENEVVRRIKAGQILEDQNVRIDDIGAYEVYIKINPDNPFDIETINQYFFTVADLVINE